MWRESVRKRKPHKRKPEVREEGGRERRERRQKRGERRGGRENALVMSLEDLDAAVPEIPGVFRYMSENIPLGLDKF